MKEIGEKLVFAEFSRLVGLEMLKHKQYEQALQLYLTTISIAVGALFFFLERRATLNLSQTNLTFLLLAMLGIGGITFLRQVGIDIAMRKNKRALKQIRDKLLEEVPDLQGIFSGSRIQHKSLLEPSSFKGVIRRALTKTQQKTIVVLANSLIFAVLLFQISAAYVAVIWIPGTVSVMAFILTGVLHVLYASWRYKQSERSVDDRVIDYYL